MRIPLVIFALLLTALTTSYSQRITNEIKYAENKSKGEAFLVDNAKKEGVQSLPSGLQYKILKIGTGEKPSLESVVKVDYVGMLIDGTKFDSSIDRGEPASFPLNAVILGWQEALQLMPTGSKWILFIPNKLAYGESDQGELIPPYSTLIFEVELLEILKQD